MSALNYLDFDLLLDRVGNKYKARVLNSPAGNATHEFDAPFSREELRAFWAQLESCLQQQNSSCKGLLQKFGKRLFVAALAGQVRSTFEASLHAADREGKGLRVRLRLADTPDLAALPWEFLYDPTSKRFLSLSNQIPMVRYLDLPERIKPLAVQPPLRLLVLVSSPWDLPALDVEHEWENLQAAVAEAERSGLLQVERLATATLPALQARLREKPFHLLHFIGHGDYDETAQSGVLYFENDDRKKRAVRGDELGILLHDEVTLRLVVLNACRGSRGSERDPFSGMAQRLVQQGIPAVLAMQTPISDTAALIFSQEFYRALAMGYPIDAAVAEGRKAIFAQGNEVEWGTPVLFMRAEDGKLFDVALSTAAEERLKIEDRKKEAPVAVQQTVSGVGGQVIQAGRDVIIKHGPAEEGNADRWSKNLKTWLGIIGTAVTIIATVLGLLRKDAEETPQAARFYGIVKYEDTGEPVPNATIRISASEQSPESLGAGQSAANGEFNFLVKASPETVVWVTVDKDGNTGFANMQILATNTIIPFRRIK